MTFVSTPQHTGPLKAQHSTAWMYSRSNVACLWHGVSTAVWRQHTHRPASQTAGCHNLTCLGTFGMRSSCSSSRPALVRLHKRHRRMPHNATMPPGANITQTTPPTPLSPSPRQCPTLDVQTGKQTNRGPEGAGEATCASIVPQLRLQQHKHTPMPITSACSTSPPIGMNPKEGAWWWGQHNPTQTIRRQYAG